MATYVRIWVFEAQKFVHLRAILVDVPDTKYQELPGASCNEGQNIDSITTEMAVMAFYTLQ